MIFTGLAGYGWASATLAQSRRKIGIERIQVFSR
jgi:hypothetical protein